jgi:hypothetical protein
MIVRLAAVMEGAKKSFIAESFSIISLPDSERYLQHDVARKYTKRKMGIDYRKKRLSRMEKQTKTNTSMQL